MNLTSDGIVVVNLDGKVLEINKKFEELHGWTREEVLGRVLPMTPPDMWDYVFDMYRRIIEGEQISGLEAQKLRKDGSTFYANVTISPIKDENGNVIAFVGVERDITEKKLAEEELLESEERYRVLVESSPEPIMVYRDFIITFVNPAAVKLLGASAANELIGHDIFRFLHPDSIKSFKENAQLQRDSSLPSSADEVTEKKLIRLDGEQIDVEMKAVPIKFHGDMSVQLLIRDVTERKAAELTLLNREKEYKRVIKLSPVPIILHRDGVIHFVNDIGFKLLGGDENQNLEGRSFFDFFLPEDYPDIIDRLTRIVLSDDYVEFHRMKLINLKGTLLDVEISSIYVHKNMGSPVIQTVIRDMTETLKADEYVRKSEKLSIVGQLAAGIAHEIRNPLTSLKGFVQLLKAKQTAYTDIMLDEIERINYIVSEFMSIAKPSTIHHIQCDIIALVENIVYFMQPQALLFNVQMEIAADRSLKPIMCDPHQVKQVLMNILKNAIESMPSGGSVEIYVRMKDDRSILLRIADHGVGIPADKLPQLGEPFFSMKENGTGLGLMVCHRIIEAHKGEIRIESTMNEGTVVDIILPIENAFET